MRLNPECGIVREVAKSFERRSLIRLDRGLRMRAEQLVALLPESDDGIGLWIRYSRLPPSPIDEV